MATELQPRPPPLGLRAVASASAPAGAGGCCRWLPPGCGGSESTGTWLWPPHSLAGWHNVCDSEWWTGHVWWKNIITSHSLHNFFSDEDVFWHVNKGNLKVNNINRMGWAVVKLWENPKRLNGFKSDQKFGKKTEFETKIKTQKSIKTNALFLWQWFI